MNSKWYIGCASDEDKKERTELIKACHPALRVLKKILEKDIEGTERLQADVESYGSAAWPYLQADRLGTIRAYNAILAILPEDDKSR